MSGKALQETLGFLAVVAGLVFVGLELRQSNVQARAATRQALANASIEVILMRAADAELDRQAQAWGSAIEDDVLDCGQTRMCALVFALLRHHENVFIQVQEGVVDESALLSYGFTGGGYYLSPLFAQLWPSLRQLFDPGFVAAFEAEYDLAP
jgi:hypothetical protein